MGLSGGHGLLDRLVDAHYAALYRYAFRLSGSAADAEDLTQETFCKAQSSLGQLREASRARGWLFRILRNIYLQRIRQQPVLPLSLDHAGEVPEPTPDPLPPVDAEQLQRALDEIPELYRTPIILYYFEDFSYRDIADQMDVPLGTVMSRLARAKAWLRSRLGATVLAADGPGRATNGL